MNAWKPLLGILVPLAIGDAVWLTLRNHYHRDLFQTIQQSPLEVRWIPAIAVYGIIVVALYFGAVQPATSSYNAMVRGMVVGILLYAFYDLTNYATLTKYTLEMTLTDIAWGTALCTVAATIGYLMYK